MKKIIMPTFLLLIIAADLLSCSDSVKGQRGEVRLVIGKVELTRNVARTIVTYGTKLTDNDVICTGADGIVVAALDNNALEIEIQSNAVFKIEARDRGKMKYNLDSGNLWMRIKKKLSRGEVYLLQTPTSTAAVRGTKFYTFKISDMTGTCYCEGTVDFQAAGSVRHDLQRQDSLTFSRGNKTIYFTPGELSFMETAHRHSALENSPLGQKERPMTPEQQKKLLTAIEKKLALLK